MQFPAPFPTYGISEGSVSMGIKTLPLGAKIDQFES